MKTYKNRLSLLGIIASIGLFIVNMMGFVDSFTDSTMGCGREWPLCNGKLFPQDWNSATTIEYTHRLIVLVVISMVIVFAVMSWIRYRRQKSVRVLIYIAIFTALAEAALGASSVLFTNPSWLLAFHMGFAFTAFASFVLLTITVYILEKPNSRYQSMPIPAFSKYSRVSMGLLFFVIYYGAFVSHSGKGALFQGWPVPLEGNGWALALDIGHRLLAVTLFILVWGMVRRSYRMRWMRPDLYRVSLISFGLTIAQMLGGAWMIVSNISTPALLFHVSIVSLLFVSLAYLVYASIPDDKEATNRVIGDSSRSDRPHPATF